MTDHGPNSHRVELPWRDGSPADGVGEISMSIWLNLLVGYCLNGTRTTSR